MNYITFVLLFVTWAGLAYLFFNSKKTQKLPVTWKSNKSDYKTLITCNVLPPKLLAKFKKLHNTNEVHVHCKKNMFLLF